RGFSQDRRGAHAPWSPYRIEYTRAVSAGTSLEHTGPGLRPWQRLSVRLAALFAIVTLVAVGLVGGLVYQRQKREVEDTVGTQLLNIARVAALLVDPDALAEADRARSTTSPAYRKLQAVLAAIRTETLLPAPLSAPGD